MVKSARPPPKARSRVSSSGERECGSINHLSLTVCECQSSALARGQRSGSISVDGISRIMDMPAARGGAWKSLNHAGLFDGKIGGASAMEGMESAQVVTGDRRIEKKTR